jgi:heme/copper-type cytochrome/quinol oxidase subunit 2
MISQLIDFSNKTCRIFLLALLTLPLTLAGQTEQEKPAMADLFRSEGKIFVVVGVMTLVFLGIIIYLIYLDRKNKPA